MGWMRGFEPPTSGSTIRRSNQLSYTHHQDRKNAEIDSIKRPQAAARSVAAKVGADGGDFHLDFVRRLGGIFRIADRAADDQLIGAAGKGDRRQHRMPLVVLRRPGGPDARTNDQQLSAEILAAEY